MVPVLEVDDKANWTSGEGVSRSEGVGNGRLLLTLHHLHHVRSKKNCKTTLVSCNI